MARRSPNKSIANLSELKKPIFIELTSGIGLWQTRLLTKAEILKQMSTKVDERLAALLKHYGVQTESNDKWKLLNCCLTEELGMIVFATEQPQIGRPRLASMEDRILAERMDKISFSRVEDAAKKLLKVFPDHYKHLTVKTLSNRYNKEKAKNRMSLSSTLEFTADGAYRLTADYPKAIGEKLRSVRSKKVKLRSQQGPAAAKAQESGPHQTSKRRAQQKESLAALNSWEKF